ncbi:DUF1853 family protein [Sessilibacter corallicola]|uniref:DUF1853 family protein n=1 Tax=Sessilibacter corallicola TaxID=2904075 RepID=A0ABQ0ADL6_9GAMM
MLTLRQRQLLWMIFSPDLLSLAPSGDSQPFQLTSDCHQIKSLIDKTLCNSELLNLKPTIRLGLLFEALLHFYLSNLQNTTNTETTHLFNHIITRLQLSTRTKPKRTLGEFDFIYSDNSTANTYHLETAVKFYLADCRVPTDLSETSTWIGPNRNDRLDLKIDKQFNHQLELSHRPEAKQLLSENGITDNIKKKFLLKGRIYLPYSDIFTKHEQYSSLLPKTVNPNAELGYWVNIGEINELLKNLDYARIINRQEWLAYESFYSEFLFKNCQQLIQEKLGIPRDLPINKETNVSITEHYVNLHNTSSNKTFVNQLRDKLVYEKKPFQICGIKHSQLNDNFQMNYYFIVPDDWSAITEPSCNQ